MKARSFDDVSPVVRARMARIRKKDTTPELLVRQAAHALGYRFRLHRRGLPGSPDLVFPSRRKVIFVHGCFWHRHGCALSGKIPAKRVEYWAPKLARNVERDREAVSALMKLGWAALMIWECEAMDRSSVERQLRNFLGPSGAGALMDARTG
jgi:DNA mismatch endonuclease, patch repair protein